MIRAIIILVVLASIEAFSVPNIPAGTKPSSTALPALELPVDPIVLAAVGLAVVGGVGTVLITSKLREMDDDAGDTPAAASTTSAASADEVDVSIPYDAAARLAYEKAGSKGDYAEFKAKYEADAVAEVKAKKK